MKNIINYFYNVNIDNIRMLNDNYYFTYYGKRFVFYEIKDSNFDYNMSAELNTILSNNNKRNNVYNIIRNKDNNILTYNLNKKYIMLLENFSQDRDFDYFDIVDTNVMVEETKKNANKINVVRWDDLWKNKVDYFEWFVSNNINKFPGLNKYYNYFIGLSENAISYFEDTLKEVKPDFYDKLVISHKRIENYYTLKDLYNPVCLVIDHKSRDLSEYLKMIFLLQKYNDEQIQRYLNYANLSNYGARILFARMLYPSFFFDDFEKLINNEVDINKVLNLIDRMPEYEKYLVNIYNVLKKKHHMIDIEWLKK